MNSNVILLSRYLRENNFELKRVTVVWHPVDYSDTDKSVKKRAFFAHVYAIDGETGQEEECLISPAFATEDPSVFLGFKCDDLLLCPYASSFPRETVLLWKYALYGDTTALCGERDYRRQEPDFGTRLSSLFWF